MNIQVTHAIIVQALSFIPAHDRDVWLKMGMALKAAFGENGFTQWDSWSQSAENYSAQAVKDVWRSLKVDGGVTIGSLMYVARSYGYRGSSCPVNATRHQPVPVQPDQKSIKRNRQRFGRWLQEAFPLDRPEADLGRIYLTTRGLEELVDRGDFPNWRLHPSFNYWFKADNGEWCRLGTFPALLAPIVNVNGQGVGLHITYLTPDGSGKARISHPDDSHVTLPNRKTRSLYAGSTIGGSIRLYTAGESLAVSEGIETALAVRISLGLQVWATVSASGMARLEIPEQVREIFVMADNDDSGIGEQAATNLAKRLLQSNRVTKIVIPEEPDTDWVDVLNKEGDGHDQ